MTSRSERPILDAALFSVFAFLITWGTGMLIVLSTHANLVNGAHQVEHPIPLPFPIAIALVMIGGLVPSSRPLLSLGCAQAKLRCGNSLVSSDAGEFTRFGLFWRSWAQRFLDSWRFA